MFYILISNLNNVFKSMIIRFELHFQLYYTSNDEGHAESAETI